MNLRQQTEVSALNLEPGNRSRSQCFLPVLPLLLALLITTALTHDVRAQKKDEPDPDAPVINLVQEPDPPKQEDGPAYLDKIVDSETYFVGPGDHIAISIIGTSPETFDLEITPEATLVIPSVGVIDLRRVTLAEAKSRIMNVLTDYYPNASPSISLLKVRHFRISVVGAVEHPGLFTVTANTRASEVIQNAILKPKAGRRSIRLIRDGDSVLVDLVAFLNLGDLESNPYLREGDVLQVPAVQNRWGIVEITGAVVAPGRFELVPGDRIGGIIDLAYGLTANADTTRLELWRFGDRNEKAERVSWPEGRTYATLRDTPLQPDDRIIVRTIDDYRRHSSVFVRGEVKRPGQYVFPGRWVPMSEVIDSAGGFTNQADLAHAYVLRRDAPTWLTERADRIEKIPVEILSRIESDWLQAEALSVPGRVSTDFVGLFRDGDKQYDLMLSDGDYVMIPELTNYVNVIGQVVQPGLVAFDPSGDLSYYLDRVGGYGWRADRGRTFVLKGGTGAAVKKGNVRSFDPGDIIVVPTKQERDLWNTFKESMVVVANLATIYLVIDQATR